MRTKAVAILLLAIFALSSIATVPIIPVSASSGSSNTLTLSDAELMLPEFTKEWGPGILTGKALIGPGVRFDFTGLQPGAGTGVGDNFPVNQLAGGAWKTYGITQQFSTWGDFSAYKRYSLCIENVGTEPITVNLKMNTGWTIPPPEYAAMWRDTYWQNGWIYIGPGECKVVCLDFSSATVYNAIDEQEFTPYPDGTPGVAMWRIDEVSDIGFQVLGNGNGSIVVKGTQLYIDPPVVNMTPSDVCTSFTVDVTLSNFANLAGFDIKLTWDGTLITETGVDYTTTLDALWGAGMWSVQVEQSGAGFYRLVAVALATSASNTGASVLFKKTFHVDRSSSVPLQTPIHFALVKLSDNTVPVPKSICAVVTDGMYYMSPPSIIYVHDVAVTQVEVSKNIVYQGSIVDIDVTAANLGNATESFNVEAWYDGNSIGTKPVDNLAPSATKLLTFQWNTAGVPLGTYQIWANASIVPGETNTANNIKYDDTVTITRTIIKVEPPVYTAKKLGEVFDLNVTVNNLNASDRAILIQFELYYDKNLIKLLNVTEGPFMKAFAGPPNGGTFSAWFDDEPDHMVFFVIIFPDGNGIWHEPFPSGNGTVATLTFTAIKQQRGLEKPPLSTGLTLLNTMILNDSIIEIPHVTQNGLYKMLPTNIGDVNYDGKVDGKDIAIIAKAFGSYPGNPRWNPEADLNGDNKIDGKDLAMCARNFGWRQDP